jgi:hypothetical protein
MIRTRVLNNVARIFQAILVKHLGEWASGPVWTSLVTLT